MPVLSSVEFRSSLYLSAIPRPLEEGGTTTDYEKAAEYQLELPSGEGGTDRFSSPSSEAIPETLAPPTR